MSYSAMRDELVKIAKAHGGMLLKPKTTAFPTDDEDMPKNMDRRRDELTVRSTTTRDGALPGSSEDIPASAVRGLV